MAISIVTNTTSMAATGQLSTVNNNLSGTIESLSTGLRINSAADDASGLAVSEKLRGQISGLSQASANAQDASSLLETAEAAMGTMTDVIQRMRELAVQSGNAAYTSSDRAMLQLEMDELMTEVDRISTSTEFNTMKLLNGDASAIWSSSNNNIEAVVTGAVVEGDYKLSYTVDPGDNAIYSTNIMALDDDALSYRMSGTNTTPVTGVINQTGMMSTSGEPAVVSAQNSLGVSAAVTLGGTGSFPSKATVATTFSNTYTDTYAYMEFEAVSDVSATDGGGMVQFRITADDGTQSNWITATIDSDGNITALGGNGLVTNTASGTVSYSFGDLTVGVGDTLLTLSGDISEGDKLLAGLTSSLSEAGSGMLTLNISGIATAIVDTTESPSKVYTAQMDNAGNVYYGSMEVVTSEVTEEVDGEATLTILGGGDVASTDTMLKDLSGFVNADGVNVLDNTQTLTIYGNAGQTTITLEGSDTISDLQDKLAAALIELGMGADSTNTAAASVNANLVGYVDGTASATSGTAQSIGGSFVVQSAILGENSELRFSADQEVLNALGFTTIQESLDSALTVQVNDAVSGAYIGEDTVSDNILRSVIQNVDVIIEPTSAADVTFNTATMTMEFTAKDTAEESYLHLVDNATVAAIGANEGQTLDISIGRLDTVSLGLSNVSIESFESSQSAITKLDMALETLSAARATAGAQMNRLEYTMTNLDTANENLTASESRIRDLDIATASTELAAQQVLMQSASAMLAQANQLPSYAAQLLG